MSKKTLSLDERQEKNRQYVESILRTAQHRHWHGTISVDIKRGEIVLVRREETFKPPKDE